MKYAVLTAAIFLGIIGGGRYALQASPTSITVAPNPLELSPQDVLSLTPQKLQQQLPLSGTLDPVQQTILTAPLAGVVERVAVREGETVVAGQVLAHFSAAELTFKTHELAQQAASAQAQLNFAQKDHALQEKLFKQQFVSQQALDKASSTRDSQAAQVRAVEAQLATAQEYLQRASIRAPFAGVITEKMVQAGQRVGTESQLFRLVNPTQLELVAPVLAAHIGQVRVGQTAQLRVEGMDPLVNAQVTRINAQANVGSRHINVYLKIENPTTRLRAGIFAQGSLALEGVEQALAVPMSAIWQEQGQTWLRVIRQGKILPVAVRTGIRDESNGLVQIVSGVAVNEKVLATPMNLAAGTPVRVQGR